MILRVYLVRGTRSKSFRTFTAIIAEENEADAISLAKCSKSFESEVDNPYWHIQAVEVPYMEPKSGIGVYFFAFGA